MKLVIDLNKGMLNLGKLVKKPVHVRGKNGKVFTRMQWVNPEDASTGHGIRMISSKKGLQDSIKDGIDKHPNFHQAMKDQGVHPDTYDEAHHPHFFLPETEESPKNRDKRLEKLEKEHGFGAVVDDTDHSNHYKHGSAPPDHIHEIYDEDGIVPKEEKSDLSDESYMRKHNIHPEIQHVIKDILDNATPKMLVRQGFKDSESNPRVRIDLMSEHLCKNHLPIIKNHIKEHIKDTVGDKFIRNVQLNALENGDVEHSFSIALHPQILREALDSMLGRDLANKFRKDMDSSYLSVNFPGKNLESIKQDGYKASTMMGYIQNMMGDEAVEQMEDLIADDGFKNEAERVDAIRHLSGMGWSDVYDRAYAENKSIGLDLEDRKPTYIALNPVGSPSGGASWFGNRHLKINDENLDEVLNHSTMTFDDSFNDTRAIPKIFDMNHLKDIFILKAIDKHPYMKGILEHGESPDMYGEWHNHKGDIPLELQYHEPELSPDQFDIMPDPAEKSPMDEGDDPSISNDPSYNYLDDLDLDDLDDLDLDDDDMVVDNNKGKKYMDSLNDLDDLDADDDNLTWDDILEDESKDE